MYVLKTSREDLGVKTAYVCIIGGSYGTTSFIEEAIKYHTYEHAKQSLDYMASCRRWMPTAEIHFYDIQLIWYKSNVTSI